MFKPFESIQFALVKTRRRRIKIESFLEKNFAVLHSRRGQHNTLSPRIGVF